MDKTKKTLLTVIALLAIALGTCIYFLTNVRNVQIPDGTEQEKPDTVYLTKFVPVKPFDYSYIPTKYFFFTETDTLEIEKIKVIHDTVTVYTKDSTQINYNSQFLTQYPSASKLVQLLLDDENLSLSLLNTNGHLSTQEFKLDLDKFKYNYQPLGMTYEKINFFKRLHPFVEAQVRPMNLLLDANLGIYHETGKIKYEFGLNGFYYPKLQKLPGWDLYFKLRYDF